jgi:hypothetical protein
MIFYRIPTMSLNLYLRQDNRTYARRARDRRRWRFIRLIVTVTLTTALVVLVTYFLYATKS